MARKSKSGSRNSSSAKAMSLHLGLNSVSPSHYEGWSGDLQACEFDAKDMAAIAGSRDMKATLLLTKDATRKKTLAALREAAGKLNSGDFFFLTYSGHGGQIPDVTGEEADKKDETWCLYDGQLIDDELYLELGGFVAGVRILVLSDSCHSGTVTRARVPSTDAGGAQRSKLMPPAVAMRTYREHRKFYDDLQKAVEKTAGKAAEPDPDAMLANVAVSPRLDTISRKFRPAVILISGCQDNQTSLDGDQNGAFTEQLLQVWDNGAFDGAYARFHATIKSGMSSTQTPNFFTLGPAAAFARQRPFTV